MKNYYCPNCENEFDEPKPTVKACWSIFVWALVLSNIAGAIMLFGIGAIPLTIIGGVIACISLALFISFAVVYAMSKVVPSTKCPRCEYPYFVAVKKQIN